MNTNKILKFVNLFYKKAQTLGFQEGDIGPIGEAIGIGAWFNEIEGFFASTIEPWLQAEIAAGNIKEGDSYSISGNISNGKVNVYGLINDTKGKLSDKFFYKATAKANLALRTIPSITPDLNYTFSIMDKQVL